MPSKAQIVVAAMALLALVLASLFLPADTNAATQRTIRIGFPSWIGFDILLHAQDSGLFEKHGLDVELIQFDEASDVARAVMSGGLDAGYAGLATLVANHDGTPLEIVLFTNISNGADGIVARSGIDSVTDLKGLRVGCKFRATNRLILAEALEHHGLTLSDITLIDVSNDTAERMLEEGSIDAAVLWEPDLSEIADRIGGTVIHRTSDLDSSVLDTLVVRADHAAASPDTVEAFQAVWFDLLDEIERHPEPVFRTVSQKLDTPVDQLAALWTGIRPGDRRINRLLLGESFESKLQSIARMMGEPMPVGIRPSPFPMHSEVDR